MLPAWLRLRDVLAGDEAIKRGGEKYVPRLDAQSDEEFRAYVDRGYFYNATARTLSGYIGMIFRREPVLQLGESSATLHPALRSFVNDVDLLGTTLDGYAKSIVAEVVCVGRAGTLIDWNADADDRAYLSLYTAESICNWRESRIDGHLQLTLVVLSETVQGEARDDDPFVLPEVPQLRVLKQAARQSVTGVVVNSQLSTPRHMRRRLRAILHNSKKTGLPAQNRNRRKDFIGWLRGMVGFVAMVNPKQAVKLRAQLGRHVG